jgi:cytosine/adenosine deaminase-related metal-dependent hydrolase
VRDAVRLVVDGERLAAVSPDARPEPADTRLAGLTLPGFGNAHSHIFHRALRGRTHHGGGDFWTWRDVMYAVAAQLDPDSYLALARAAYAELVLAGYTAVGEFHYVHHGPGGTPYADPNVMGAALQQAAADAGIRLTLLDVCYLRGGLGPHGHTPLTAAQRRFGDADVEAWAQRAADRTPICAPSPSGPTGPARPARCTCTCPSNRPRTTPAQRYTGAAPPNCSSTRVCWSRGWPRCTPPT